MTKAPIRGVSESPLAAAVRRLSYNRCTRRLQLVNGGTDTLGGRSRGRRAYRRAPEERRCQTGPSGLFGKERRGRPWRAWARLGRRRSTDRSAVGRALATMARPSGPSWRFVTVESRARRLRRAWRVLKGPALLARALLGGRPQGGCVPRVAWWCTLGTRVHHPATLGTPRYPLAGPGMLHAGPAGPLERSRGTLGSGPRARTGWEYDGGPAGWSGRLTAAADSRPGQPARPAQAGDRIQPGYLVPYPTSWSQGGSPGSRRPFWPPGASCPAASGPVGTGPRTCPGTSA